MAEPEHPAKEQIDQFVGAMKRMAETLAPAMLRFAEQMRGVGVKLDDILWRAYEEAGYPYGPNYHGRDRWMRELAEIQALRERADEIEFWHESMAELRRLTKPG